MPRKKPTKSKLVKLPDDDFESKMMSVQQAEVQRLASAHTEDAIRSLVEIATATERKLIPNDEGYFEVVMESFETEEGELVTQPVRKPYLPGPRATAAKALLEHAHGRPTQRVQHDGRLGDARITVVLQSFKPNGEQVAIDVTPTPERIGGADPPAERVGS